MRTTLFTIAFTLLLPSTLLSDAKSPVLPSEGVLGDKFDSFLDLSKDHSSFPGRVKDKDETGRIIKIQSENPNVRFFKAGDRISFTVPKIKMDRACDCAVRGVDDDYVILYIKNLDQCWGRRRYFRRGTQLDFTSVDFVKRLKEVSVYRKTLINQREDFLSQLNKLNHFIWSFDQIRASRAAEYDKRILELQNQKSKALDDLVVQKQDTVRIQKELVERLDQIDENLKFYRPKNPELLVDRWNMDHDQGLPVGERPQKEVHIRDDKKHRWHKSDEVY